MADERRSGDDRPVAREPGQPLTFTPAAGEPVRWLPRHGQPYCVLEWFSQRVVQAVAWWPVYTAIVVTLILAIQVFHPFGLGR